MINVGIFRTLGILHLVDDVGIVGTACGGSVSLSIMYGDPISVVWLSWIISFSSTVVPIFIYTGIVVIPIPFSVG